MRRIVRLLVLSALLLVAPKILHAQSCSASSAGIYFGNVSTPVAQTDATGTITVNCSGGNRAQVHVCLGLEPAGTLANRLMFRDGDAVFSTSVDYEIFTSAGRTTPWNTTNRVLVTVPMTGGSGSTNVSMYGRMMAGANPAAGIYRSGLSDDRIEGTIQSAASCTSSTQGSFSGGTFDVNTYVLGTCTISADSLINFGAVAGTMPAAVTANGALHVQCNNQMPYTIALNAGNITGSTIADRRLGLNGTGAGVVRYQFYLDAGYTQIWGDGSSGAVYPGTGSGNLQDITIYGRVPQQALPGGTYRSTVTATVTY